MNIEGLDKAEVLAALYNGSRQQGMGFIHTRGAEGMTVEQAREELANNESGYFDYLHGRVMKISLRGDELNTVLYNRDNGQGTAESIIEDLRSNALGNRRAAFGASVLMDGLAILRRRAECQITTHTPDLLRRFLTS